MQIELSCPLCNAQYSEEKPPRILSVCGHSFCEACIEANIVSYDNNKYRIICPEDNAICEMLNNDPKQFTMNRSLLKIAQSNKTKTPHKDHSFQLSKTTKEEQFQEDLEIHEFKDLSNQESIEYSPNGNMDMLQPSYQRQQSSSSQDEENLCLLHQKPLQIICVYDLQKICSKCAIFGQHKGHDFKSIEQIEEEKQIFFQQIQAVFGLKTEISSRIEQKSTKPEIISILSGNKDMLSKQIKQNFKKLVDSIKTQESKALNKLQQINKKIEKDIDQLYKISPSLIERYQDWERLAKIKLDIIKKGTFEEQLELLINVQSIKEKNTLSQGQILVQLIHSQESNIINKSEALLGSINLKFSNEIYGLVENFVEVLNSQQQIQTLEQEIIESPQVQVLLTISNKFSQINLLQNQGHMEEPLAKVVFLQSPIKSVQNIDIQIDGVKLVPFIEGKTFELKSNKKTDKKVMTKRQFPKQKMKTESSQQIVSFTSRQSSFVSQKSIRPPKKKLKSIKLPEKYQKILENLYADTLEILDLTNAQLGDYTVFQITEFLPNSKVKTVKLIRNKLTDEGVAKILPFLGDLITINLSQNLLTEKILDVFIKNRQLIPKAKNIILSMNKIIQRKHKSKIDELRKLQIVVSV